MRRLFLFLVLVLFGSLLLGEAFATELTTKTIAGTEFTLLSNTDQCLSNCESWIQWDLSKGILSNVQLPSKSNSQFGFDLIKANEQTVDLTSFGVEVWKEKGTIVQDYRIEEEVYEISLIELRGLDANAQANSCEDYGCTEKVKDVCNCSRTISVPNGSHTEYVWEKVSDDFFGFEAQQGEIYRLRVWGNRKATIGSNGVDWIPTFFGERITEWAWWLTGWESKFPINSMVLDIDLNSTNWIKLTKANFNLLNSACANAADITIVNETTGIEVSDLNFEGWDGTSTDSDVNILFKLTEDIVANTYNGEYYVYSNNDVCPVPTNRVVDQSAFDDFEDGVDIDIVTSAPFWTKNASLNDTVTVEASAAKFGSYGLKVVTGAGGHWSYFQKNGYNEKLYNLCGWINSSDVTETSHIIGDNTDAFTFGTRNDDFYALSSDGTVHSGAAWTVNPVDNTWYKFCVRKDLTTETFSIYDSTATLLEKWSTPTTAETLDEIMMQTSGAFTVFFDNISFMPPNQPTYVFGSLENFSTVDLNITTINGESFLTHPIFSFGLDGNITIDFNVYLSNNGRLLLDLNYSQSTIQGTGNVIVKDLNLTSKYCPNQNFATVSECSVSWNVSNVVDGNYTIIGLLTASSTLFDFNAGDGNFEVLNDVNLLIKIPIDEETFELINLDTYSFRVSYSDGNNFFVFNNLTAPIYLSVPFGEIFLTFTIDENTSDYYPRHYSLNFPTFISSATLQPYLIKKVTAGGTGIQSVLFTKTENNKAVPSIEIRAYRVVPNSGKTLMEQLVTDAAGSATFAFVQNETYTLDFLSDGNIFSSLTLQPVFSSYQFYLSAEVFNVPDENALIFDVNYSPSLDYIDSNTWADINISILVRNTIISDLNILIYLDDNTLFNVIVFVDGFYNLPPVSIVGATKILNVEVILTTADGLRLSRSKAYSYNLSIQQKGLNEFFEDLPGLVNFVRNSIHLEISTLGFLLLTIFICGAIKSKSQIDTGGLALFGLLLMGVWTYMGFVYLPAFLVAIIIAFALVIFSRAF